MFPFLPISQPILEKKERPVDEYIAGHIVEQIMNRKIVILKDREIVILMDI